MRTVDVDALLAPYPTGYYSQQCQCTRAEMDRIIAQNAQQSINMAFLAPVPKPQYTTTARRGYTGDCKRCGAPENRALCVYWATVIHSWRRRKAALKQKRNMSGSVSMRLIDADELLERMQRSHRNSADVPFIRSQNPVDAVRVVHSSWDYGETGPEPDENNNVQANCRNCGAGDTHATRMINKVPYCWNCGAKMEVQKSC